MFGPCENDRFGIVYAREKIESYKKDLRERILTKSSEYGLRKEVLELMDSFEKHLMGKS